MKLLQWLLGLGLLGIAMIITGLTSERDGLITGGSVIVGSVLISTVLLVSEVDRK